MKSFTVSVVLAALMALAIVANALYINNVGERAKNAILSLPDPADATCISATEKLEQDWKRYARQVHISVNHTLVDRIEEYLATLTACASCGDVYGFYTARALALDALRDMQRLENVAAVF